VHHEDDLARALRRAREKLRYEVRRDNLTAPAASGERRAEVAAIVRSHIASCERMLARLEDADDIVEAEGWEAGEPLAALSATL
jgi:hypothetical protein